MDKPHWHLRAPSESDVSFVFNSFLKTFRDSTFVAGTPNSTYYPAMHAIVESLLKRSNIVIACDPAEPDLIYGWGVGEVDKDVLILHFFYCKHALRGFGVAKAMEAELLKLPHTSVRYSTRTPPVFKAISRRQDYTYDPFTFWGK